MILKKILLFTTGILCLYSCNKNTKQNKTQNSTNQEETALEIKEEFGYDLNKYIVVKDTIKSGDSFGEIMLRNHLNQSEIHKIVKQSENTFDISNLQIGKPYTILCTRGDSISIPKCFIYQPNKIDYIVIDFADTTQVKKGKKEVTTIERKVAGVINSSLYQTLIAQNLSPVIAYEMADIYAWTIDFFRIQNGDQFKIIFTEKYIEDSIYVGLGEIKATYFNHKNKPFYAFKFQTDSVRGIEDYYDEEANSLRRAFLKAPVKFSRISSRYNLKRRIPLYGNRIRPHKGTDFAAPVGTPIMATANGTVIESRKRRGNGNYVKLKHNSVYSTQYLHMKKRKVKKGDFVKQGDVIGWVGMTGNTSGPHVCYRFWKNGKQVDPFKEDLPKAETMAESLKHSYKKHIKPLKLQLDSLTFKK